MVRRAIIYCTTPNSFATEINHLRTTFALNAYPDTVINKYTSTEFIENLKLRISSPKSSFSDISDNSIWLRIPYDPYIWSPLRKICSKYKIKLSGSKTFNIGNMITNIRPPIIPLEYSGGAVYRIKCQACDTFYIGETLQKVNDRMNQHKNKCTQAINTNVAPRDSLNDCGPIKHAVETGHIWSFLNPVLLAKIPNGPNRELREGMEIYIHKINGFSLCNVMDGKTVQSCWYELLHDFKHSTNQKQY